MKLMMAAIIIALTCLPTFAQDSPFVLQLKYSPLGTINADEDAFDDPVGDYQEYDMGLEYMLGAKLIYDPIYFSVQHNITNPDEDSPDATLDTISFGLAGFNYDRFAYDYGLYLMGSIGIGAGQLTFEGQEKNDWETLIEAGAEVGFRLQEHFLLGLGVDYQLFGELGETKAHYWNLYISTGIIF